MLNGRRGGAARSAAGEVPSGVVKCQDVPFGRKFKQKFDETKLGANVEFLILA